jgi:hypothetical protein
MKANEPLGMESLPYSCRSSLVQASRIVAQQNNRQPKGRELHAIH